jgi:hypothetical protein
MSSESFTWIHSDVQLAAMEVRTASRWARAVGTLHLCAVRYSRLALPLSSLCIMAEPAYMSLDKSFVAWSPNDVALWMRAMQFDERVVSGLQLRPAQCTPVVSCIDLRND